MARGHLRTKFASQLSELVALPTGSSPPDSNELGKWQVQLARMRQLAASLSPIVADAQALELLKTRQQDITWRLLGAVHQQRVSLSPRASEFLRVLETTPDLLDPIGMSRQEIVHSQALAWFLDEQRSGGIGRRCLEAFRTIVENREIGTTRGDVPEAFDFGQKPSVATEVFVGLGDRVDIVLRSTSSIAFVEVKVDAPEGDRQLDRYAVALRGAAGSASNRWLVFLTVDPKSTTSTSFPYRHVSFVDIVRALIPVASEQLTPGHQFLRMYLKAVARHLLNIVDGDGFDSWSLASKWSAIRFVQSIEEVSS